MFKIAPTLDSENLLLRPLIEQDFDDLFSCAGNKRVWAGHPSTERYKKENFKQWFSDALASKNSLAIIEKSTNKIIGSTRFYFDGIPENAVAIGYTFLSYQYWGGNVNKELKAMMLSYAFEFYESVWFHISPINIRSQKAILKIGASYVKEKTVSLGGSEPSLWRFYKIVNPLTQNK